MITIGKTKSVCPECMKVVPAKKCIGEDGIYLVKECNVHGKFQTLIWEGNAADYLSWGRENLSAEIPVNPKIKEKCDAIITDLTNLGIDYKKLFFNGIN